MLTLVERSTQWYSFNLKKEDRTPMPGSSLLAIYGTFYELTSETIINGKDGLTDYLGGIFTVDVDGKFLWELTPADNPYLGMGVKEVHRLVLKIVWPPARVFYHVVDFEMTNIKRVS